MSSQDSEPISSNSGLAKFLQRLSPGFHSNQQRTAPLTSNTLPVGVVVSTGDEVHEREALLNQIDDGYFEEDFDAIGKELGSLTLSNNAAAELKAAAEERSLALDCISETLSTNILRDYDRFNQALTCITDVRDAVTAAKTSAKVSREHLARCSAEISQGVKVWKSAQKKKNIARTLAILQKMQSALRLLGQVDDSLEDARYGTAVEQCLSIGEIVATDLSPHGIYAADILSAEANRLLCEIAEQMFVSLSSMTCGNFDEDQYVNLLEGYMHLTDPDKIVGGSELSPSEEIVSAFTAAPYHRVKCVLAGICGADGGLLYGGQEVELGFVELLAKQPAESFKKCLQMVLKVEFDILLSFRMLERWHNVNGAPNMDIGKSSSRSTSLQSTKHGKEMLGSIQKSLPRAKRLLWNEVSGSLMTVLQSIKPGYGEAFVVVSTWVRDFLTVGKAFSGEDSGGLESILSRQSIRFFKGHHINCIEALFAILEREAYAEVDIVLPWLDVEEEMEGGECWKARNPNITDIDLDDCVERTINPWDHDDERDSGRCSSQHYDSKTALRMKNVSLGDGRHLSTTNSFWRLVKWIMDYVALMYDLPSAAPVIAGGLLELITMFIMHIYASFVGTKHGSMDPWYASTRLDEFVSISMGTGVGGIGTYTPAFEAWFPMSPIGPLLRSALTSSASSASSIKKAFERSSSAKSNNQSKNKTGHVGPSTNAVCNSGNLYGLVERVVSNKALKELASFLQQLRDSGIIPFSTIDAQTEEQFLRTIEAIPDIGRCLYGTCCALLLPTAWIPEAVAQGSYIASDPPLSAAPWTARLGRQLELLAAQLQSSSVSMREKQLLWSFVFPAISHSIVDGLASVKKCTLEGRSAMSLDLQAVSKHLLHKLFDVETEGPAENAIAANKAIRYIDDYIKGFYIPIPDLQAWANTHPDYTRAQVIALAKCAADSLGGATAKEDVAKLEALLPG